MGAEKSRKGPWRYRRMVRGIWLRSLFIYRTKAAVLEAEAEAVGRFLRTGLVDQNPDQVDSTKSVGELLAEWIRWLYAHRSREHAYRMESLMGRAQALAPHYSGLPVLSLTDAVASQWVEDLRRAGWSPRNRFNFIRYAQTAWGHPWGKRRARPTYPTNPWQYLDRPQIRYKAKYVPPREHIQAIRAAAGGEFRLWVEVELETGARPGEVLNLAWEDIGPDTITLYTSKTAGGHRKPRRLAISPQLADRLRTWRKAHLNTVYVFQQADQEAPRHPIWARKQLGAAIRRVNTTAQEPIKPFPLGSFRHYRASLWAREGVPLTTIQARLGHSKATMTDHYLRELVGV